MLTEISPRGQNANETCMVMLGFMGKSSRKPGLVLGPTILLLFRKGRGTSLKWFVRGSEKELVSGELDVYLSSVSKK